jgi:MSHA pilin protein MshA
MDASAEWGMADVTGMPDALRSNNAVKLVKTSVRARGFSLVEVVVLLSLMGMAAAFAVPRFTTLANRARASEVVALGASLSTAAQLAHAQYLASGATLAAAKFEGQTVTLKNGYPDATREGIGSAFVDADGFVAKVHPTSVTFVKTGAPSEAQCAVTYHAAVEPKSVPTVNDINIGGC